MAEKSKTARVKRRRTNPPKSTRATPEVETVDEMKELCLRAGDMASIMEELAKGLQETGLEDVKFDFLGGYGYRFRAGRGRNQSCQTPQGVEATVKQIAHMLRFELDDGAIVAFVEGELVGAAFRLRPVL